MNHDEQASNESGTMTESQGALGRLFGEMCRNGAHDEDPLRRMADRYELSLGVEVRRDVDDEDMAMPATLRNISRTGISIWCRQPVTDGDRLHIRIYPPGARPEWIEADAVHAQEGRGGVLVGARLVQPLSAEFEARLREEIRKSLTTPTAEQLQSDMLAEPQVASRDSVAGRHLAWTIALCVLSLAAGVLLTEIW